MSSFRCPRCPQTLGFVRRDALRWWQCPDHHGRAFNFTMVRKRAGPDRFRAFWTALRAAEGTGDVSCPSCGRGMVVVRQSVGDAVVEVDACKSCQMVWFDQGEDTSITGGLPEAAPDPLAHLAPEDRLEVKMAEARLTMESSRHSEGYADEPGHASGLGKLGSMLGIPVEDNEPARSVVPFVSWGLTAAMAVLGGVAMANAGHAYDTYGFLAETPLRGGGVPAVAGALYDPRFFSVFLNAIVFWRLGDNVEDLLGHVGFGVLVAVSTVAAWGVHALGLSHFGQPMFGLTSAAAATAVLYALRFPEVRLGWYYFHRGGWFRDDEAGWWMVPIRWGVVGWVALALAVPWMMAEPEVPNSWAEALVGAGIGAAAWALFGRGVVRHPDEL